MSSQTDNENTNTAFVFRNGMFWTMSGERRRRYPGVVLTTVHSVYSLVLNAENNTWTIERYQNDKLTERLDEMEIGYFHIGHRAFISGAFDTNKFLLTSLVQDVQLPSEPATTGTIVIPGI